MIYKKLIRPILFKIDSERVHDGAMVLANVFKNSQLLRKAFYYEDPRLACHLFGKEFKNPIGLAAGFDKNASAIGFFSALGFGHVEVGTVTSLPQPGNPKPRIFRMPNREALINRMGFPSAGMEQLALKLSEQRAPSCVLGINIGKSKVVPVDDAAQDYLKIFNHLKDFGDYFVLNVSSPNTPELRKLQEKDRLLSLLKAIEAANLSRKPVLIKIAPDLDWNQIDELLEVLRHSAISGIITTNTTIARPVGTEVPNEVGGLSGKPLFPRALEVLSYVYKHSSKKIPIIGVGGVSCANDVIEMIKAGASAVQIYTGLVYQGPFLVKQIKQDLVRYLDRHGIKQIGDLIGVSSN